MRHHTVVLLSALLAISAAAGVTEDEALAVARAHRDAPGTADKIEQARQRIERLAGVSLAGVEAEVVDGPTGSRLLKFQVAGADGWNTIYFADGRSGRPTGFMRAVTPHSQAPRSDEDVTEDVALVAAREMASRYSDGLTEALKWSLLSEDEGRFTFGGDAPEGAGDEPGACVSARVAVSRLDGAVLNAHVSWMDASPGAMVVTQDQARELALAESRKGGQPWEVTKDTGQTHVGGRSYWTFELVRSNGAMGTLTCWVDTETGSAQRVGMTVGPPGTHRVARNAWHFRYAWIRPTVAVGLALVVAAIVAVWRKRGAAHRRPTS